MRHGLIAGAAFLLLPGTLAAVQFGAEPTIFLVNLDAYPGYVFYVYLSSSELDRGSVPFQQRWSKVEAGLPVRFPAARAEKSWWSGKNQAATLYGVPKDLTDAARDEPQPDWFSGKGAGVLAVGQLPHSYARNDMFGQRAKIYHYQLEGAASDLALRLLREKDDYDMREYVLAMIFSSPFTPAFLLIFVVGVIALAVRVVRRMHGDTVG